MALRTLGDLAVRRGKRLRARRQAMGVTAGALGEMIGLTAAHVGDMERGVRAMPQAPEIIAAWERGLHVPEGWIGDEALPTPPPLRPPQWNSLPEVEPLRPESTVADFIRFVASAMEFRPRVGPNGWPITPSPHAQRNVELFCGHYGVGRFGPSCGSWGVLARRAGGQLNKAAVLQAVRPLIVAVKEHPPAQDLFVRLASIIEDRLPAPT